MTGWLLSCLITAAVVVSVVAAYVFVLLPWHLRWGTTEAEASEPLPGDEVVASPTTQATHAITIRASAAEVWPWLVQLGQDRGGFYSYTWLENLFGCHMHNADRVVPEWQHLKAGDGILFHPKLPRVPVAVLEPNRALVIGGLLDPRTGAAVGAPPPDPAACGATGWAFVLREAGDGETRLIVRLRGRLPRGLRSWLTYRLFWEPAHFIMERRMLLTLKRLAEGRASEEAKIGRQRVTGVGSPSAAG
jgi:hypothetical protein